MAYNPKNPLIVQGDKTILMEVDNEFYEAVRDEVAGFAELEKSPEHIHTYRVSPLSLWNAASSGMKAEEIIDVLEKYGKFDLPQNVKRDIEDNVARYGKVRLVRRNREQPAGGLSPWKEQPAGYPALKEGLQPADERVFTDRLQQSDELLLVSDDRYIISEIAGNKKVQPYLKGRKDDFTLAVDPAVRGHIKHALIKIGFPVEDMAGYIPGTHFDIELRKVTAEGREFKLRDYQRQAVDVFYAGGSSKGGSGVIVLPCGAGKTVVGMMAMGKVKTETLVLTTNITALRQWKQELLDKTSISEEYIGEYSGEVKEIKPVTITTYQILTHRKDKDESFPHFEIFNKKDWGLIIYDEVHLLPAPVFRITAEIQARRRLGLTATLVREDGLEEDVFSLIGPKKYDVPWKVLEKKGWIACANCTEIRVPMPENIKMAYAVSDSREKFRIASENHKKMEVIDSLLEKHRDDNVLIIGQYIDQLNNIAEKVNVPVITGKTPNHERIRLYEDFKRGRLKTLVVSKVANFAIDLPDANVAIQVSGTFGSRQEEAQRLGRILRPKPGDNVAHFYSVVTTDSKEQDFAANRQMFLTEQGYKYYIKRANEIVRVSGMKQASNESYE